MSTPNINPEQDTLRIRQLNEQGIISAHETRENQWRLSTPQKEISLDYYIKKGTILFRARKEKIIGLDHALRILNINENKISQTMQSNGTSLLFLGEVGKTFHAMQMPQPFAYFDAKPHQIRSVPNDCLYIPCPSLSKTTDFLRDSMLDLQKFQSIIIDGVKDWDWEEETPSEFNAIVHKKKDLFFNRLRELQNEQCHVLVTMTANTNQCQSIRAKFSQEFDETLFMALRKSGKYNATFSNGRRTEQFNINEFIEKQQKAKTS
jgi:hypothetical protein